MPLATALTTDIFKNAGIAYAHYLSFMLCFAALVLERRILKPDPNRSEATAMIVTDVVYGIAALALLSTGILRVLYFGQGSSFYTHNPLFWWKVGVFLAVGGVRQRICFSPRVAADFCECFTFPNFYTNRARRGS